MGIGAYGAGFGVQESRLGLGALFEALEVRDWRLGSVFSKMLRVCGRVELEFRVWLLVMTGGGTPMKHAI